MPDNANAKESTTGEREGILRSHNAHELPDRELLTKQEVMDFLDIGPHAFYRYRKQYPGFRTVKTGGKTKMRRSTLLRFLEELEEHQAA